jgi:hypothetical protein
VVERSECEVTACNDAYRGVEAISVDGPVVFVAMPRFIARRRLDREQAMRVGETP